MIASDVMALSFRETSFFENILYALVSKIRGLLFLSVCNLGNFFWTFCMGDFFKYTLNDMTLTFDLYFLNIFNRAEL